MHHYSIQNQWTGVNCLRNRVVVIDETFLLRQSALRCIQIFEELKCHITFRINKNFRTHLAMLVDSVELQSLFTDTMIEEFLTAVESLDSLLPDQTDSKSSAYRLFESLSGKKVFATGNHTEALRHILNSHSGDILLVTDEDVLYIRHNQFSSVIAEYGKIEDAGKVEIPIPREGHRIINSSGTEFKNDGILNDMNAMGSEAMLIRSGSSLLKWYYNSVSYSKIKKLRRLIEFPHIKPQFAWPRDLLYVKQGYSKQFVGFSMKKVEFFGNLDDVLCGYKLTDYDRWQIAVNLASQVLFLYLFDIQPADYNFGNFCVQDNLHVALMDVDSYVYGSYGTHARSPNPIFFKADYSSKADVIAADYYYLHAIVFFILTNCRWPYVQDERTGMIQYVLHSDKVMFSSDEIIRGTMPFSLRQYFEQVLDQHWLDDPFALYYELMAVRKDYANGLPSYSTDLPAEADWGTRILHVIQEKKKTGFWHWLRQLFC